MMHNHKAQLANLHKARNEYNDIWYDNHSRAHTLVNRLKRLADNLQNPCYGISTSVALELSACLEVAKTLNEDITSCDSKVEEARLQLNDAIGRVGTEFERLSTESESHEQAEKKSEPIFTVHVMHPGDLYYNKWTNIQYESRQLALHAIYLSTPTTLEDLIDGETEQSPLPVPHSTLGPTYEFTCKVTGDSYLIREHLC